MRKLFAVVVASVLSATSLAAQSVAGDWSASYDTPGGKRTFKLALVVDGEKLSGVVKRESGDSPLTGTVKGDSVKFSYTIKYNDNQLAMTIAAKVTGDVMKGTVDFAGQAQEAFEAKKVSAADRKPTEFNRN